REGLASFLTSFWEFEREQPFLHSHASLGNLPAPSEWAIIFADWYIVDYPSDSMVGRHPHL
ncbi:hypothetical protein, partial [Alteromonas macleodii]|uniref:hypothetical protein n=2 Tax=Alteromonas TaxID=226 RepID=UPI0034A1F182